MQEGALKLYFRYSTDCTYADGIGKVFRVQRRIKVIQAFDDDLQSIGKDGASTATRIASITSKVRICRPLVNLFG